MFSVERLMYIEKHIDLSGSSRTLYGFQHEIENVTDLTSSMPNVAQWFETEALRTQILGDNVLNRYNSNLPPDLFAHILNVTSVEVWENFLLLVQASEFNRKKDAAQLQFLVKTFKEETFLKSAEAIGIWLENNKYLS